MQRTIHRLIMKAKGFSDSLSILDVVTFHRVLVEPDPLVPGWPTATEFRKSVQHLKTISKVVPLSFGVDQVLNKKVPGVYSSISFDDGYADNFEVASKVLSQECVSATFFVASEFIDGSLMFNDLIREAVRQTKLSKIDVKALGAFPIMLGTIAEKRAFIRSTNQWLKYLGPDERDHHAKAIAEELGLRSKINMMMTDRQMLTLANSGFEIGSHTSRHLIATTVTPSVFEIDVIKSKARLEAAVQQPIRLFAFPNGKTNLDFNEEYSRVIENCGFDAAFSTEQKVITPQSNRFALPRFTPWSNSPIIKTIQLANAIRGRSESV